MCLVGSLKLGAAYVPTEWRYQALQCSRQQPSQVPTKVGLVAGRSPRTGTFPASHIGLRAPICGALASGQGNVNEEPRVSMRANTAIPGRE